jgi:hypothetical protein
MKKIILVSALALLAACGSSKDTASGNTTSKTPTAATATTGVSTDATTVDVGANAAPTEDTIKVDNISDIPPACVELFTDFLKQIEPDVSKIDWAKATPTQFQTVGESFSKAETAMNSQMTATGCDKYDLNATDEQSAAQLIKIAEDTAPGTVGFLKFIQTLSTATTTSPAGSATGTCEETIAQIEAFIGDGTPLKDRPVAETVQLTPLLSALTTQCTAEEATAFYNREDVTAFLDG